MRKYNVTQCEEDWLVLRAGVLTASNMFKIISPTGIQSKQAAQLQNQLLGEQIINRPAESFKSDWMNRGNEIEAQARAYYEFVHDTQVEQIGFATTDDYLIGASPDGLINPSGGLEIKSPKMDNHIQNILDEGIDKDYYPQIQANIYVCGREWWDIQSFYPGIDFKPIRVKRDEFYIAKMLSFTREFYQGLEAKRYQLIEKGYQFINMKEKLSALEINTGEVNEKTTITG